MVYYDDLVYDNKQLVIGSSGKWRELRLITINMDKPHAEGYNLMIRSQGVNPVIFKIDDDNWIYFYKDENVTDWEHAALNVDRNWNGTIQVGGFLNEGQTAYFDEILIRPLLWRYDIFFSERFWRRAY